MEFQNKMNKILSDSLWTPMILVLGVFAWFLKIDIFILPIFAIYFFLMFLYCDDIKNFYGFFIFVPTFFNKFTSFNWINISSFSISILLVTSGIIFYLVKHLKHHTNLKKGMLFYPFIVYVVAHLIGGVIANFQIVPFLLILFFAFVVYFFYWTAINFGKNLRKYFRTFFIWLGFLISIQLLVAYSQTGIPFFEAIMSRNVLSIGFSNINNVALTLVFSMISCFDSGLKKEKDYLSIFPATYFLICIFFTYSRSSLGLAVVFFLISLILMFIYSKNKTKILSLCGVALVIIYLIILFNFASINKLLSWYISMGTSANGRDILWPWCLDKFIQNPIFGYGFYSSQTVPTISTNVIMAHNTIIQFLTSTGIVGSALAGYFYIKKYILTFSKLSVANIFPILNILMLELWGFLQPFVISPFLIIISLLYLAIIEQNNRALFQIEQEEINFKKIKTKVLKKNKKLK